MEYVAHTHRGVAEWLGGVLVNGRVEGGIRIPDLDSMLVGFSPNTRVVGFDSVPASLRPPLLSLIHLSFDLMVAIGSGLVGWAAWLAWSWWRHRDLPAGRRLRPLFLAGTALTGVGAITAMEAGWVVTEVGRQPWIVYKVMLVSQAVTPSDGVSVTLAAVIIVYLFLTAATVAVTWAMGRRWRRQPTGEGDVPYGPRSPAAARIASESP